MNSSSVYLSLNGNNLNGTLNDPNKPFSSLVGILNYLQDQQRNVKDLTIYIVPGTYHESNIYEIENLSLSLQPVPGSQSIPIINGYFSVGNNGKLILNNLILNTNNILLTANGNGQIIVNKCIIKIDSNQGGLGLANSYSSLIEINNCNVTCNNIYLLLSSCNLNVNNSTFSLMSDGTPQASTLLYVLYNCIGHLTNNSFLINIKDNICGFITSSESSSSALTLTNTDINVNDTNDTDTNTHFFILYYLYKIYPLSINLHNFSLILQNFNPKNYSAAALVTYDNNNPSFTTLSPDQLQGVSVYNFTVNGSTATLAYQESPRTIKSCCKTHQIASLSKNDRFILCDTKKYPLTLITPDSMDNNHIVINITDKSKYPIKILHKKKPICQLHVSKHKHTRQLHCVNGIWKLINES